MKRLVCFFDGTWNKPEDADQTNVVKLQRAVPRPMPAGSPKSCTTRSASPPSSALGEWTFAVGAVGFGVGSRIQGGYRFLCENYEDGRRDLPDRLLARSFEARSLAGLIALAGIARSADPGNDPDVWDCYERNKLARNPARCERPCAPPHTFRSASSAWPCGTRSAISAFPFVRKGLIKELLGFHDTELSPRSTSACTLLPSTSRAGPSDRRCGPSRRAPRCRRAR